MGLIKKVIEKNIFFGAKAELFSLALQMRKNPTEAERVMWKLLRRFRQSGFPCHDEGRTGELERFGIKVLRFTNNQILHDSDLVVEKINTTIKELTTTSRMVFPLSSGVDCKQSLFNNKKMCIKCSTSGEGVPIAIGRGGEAGKSI